MQFGHTFASLLIVLCATTASAQVHRCKDATGKLVFSDRPCEASQSGELVQRKRTQGEILLERDQAMNAERRKQAQRLAEQEREAADQRRGLQNPPVVGSATNDWQRRKDAENAATTSSSITNNRSRWDQKAEAERARARREEALRTPAPNPPAMITTCNAGFCSDTNGNTYYRNGNHLNSTDGRTCTMQAGYAHCN